MASLLGIVLISLGRYFMFLLGFIFFGGFYNGPAIFHFVFNLIVMLGVPIIVGYVAARIAKNGRTAHGVVAALIVSFFAILIFNIQHIGASYLILIAYLLPESLHFIVPESVHGGYVDGTPVILAMFVFGSCIGARIFFSQNIATSVDVGILRS